MKGNVCVQSSGTRTLETVLTSKLILFYCIYSCMRQKAHLMAWTQFIWISVVQPMIEVVFAGSNRLGVFQ